MLTDGRYQAARVFVNHDEVIENGVVLVRNGTLVEVEKSKTPSAQCVDLGNVAMVPGFVNAHTHLEFSDLPNPVGQRGIPFTQWLKLVIQQRISVANVPANKAKAIRQGIRESVAVGVSAIGEIASGQIESAAYEQVGGVDNILIFAERLTRNSDRIREVAQSNQDWLLAESDCVRAISPHAPYSVAPELLKDLVEQARRFQCVVAMHLAETREEIELLENASGPFVDFLQSIGAWFPDSFSPRFGILDHLKILALAPHALIVHGNYLTAEQIDFIAGHRDSLSLVFCPRTHHFFGHDRYPLREFLRAGIRVAVGTDSRASNPDLSLFEELRWIRQAWPELSDREILRLGTTNGYSALGIQNRSLRPGQAARVNLIEFDSSDGVFGSTARLKAPMSG